MCTDICLILKPALPQKLAKKPNAPKWHWPENACLCINGCNMNTNRPTVKPLLYYYSPLNFH